MDAKTSGLELWEGVLYDHKVLSEASKIIWGSRGREEGLYNGPKVKDKMEDGRVMEVALIGGGITVYLIGVRFS